MSDRPCVIEKGRVAITLLCGREINGKEIAPNTEFVTT